MRSNGQAGGQQMFETDKAGTSGAAAEDVPSPRVAPRRLQGSAAAQGSLARTYRTFFFVLVCFGSLILSAAPALASIADVMTTGLLYALYSGLHYSFKQFTFQTNIADVPLMSVLRSGLMLLSFCFPCDHHASHRPYLLTAIVCSAVSAVYIIVKAAMFHYHEAVIMRSKKLHDLPTWVAPVAFAVSACLAGMHVLVAHRTVVEYKRRRAAQGLYSFEDFGSAQPTLRQQPRGGAERQRLLQHQESFGYGHLTHDIENQKEDDDLDATLLADSDSKFITVAGIRSLHYKVCGDLELFRPPETSNTALVLLHGFGAGVFAFRHIMGSLAQHLRCKVVAFDRPGFGLTFRPHRSDFTNSESPYSFHAQVHLTLELCAALGLHRVVLVGHADGALLALMTAAAASDSQFQVEVAGLVLLAADVSGEVIPKFTRLLLQTKLGRQMMRPLLRSEIGDVSNRKAWADSEKISPEVLEQYKAPLQVKGWDRALAEVGRLHPPNEDAVTAVLQAVCGIPTLVVSGKEDRIVASKETAKLVEKLPGSVLLELPDCGHLPHEEAPRALLEAVIPFIEKLEWNLQVTPSTPASSDKVAEPQIDFD
eukprot:jgi/Chlat1/3590/Chrsp234S03572